MDTKQPEALILAALNDAETWPGELSVATFAARSAAELRRQHAEIETLRAGYDAARLEIESLKERVQQLGKAARDVNSRRVQELESQLEAIGAGGVEPLRRRCLHQISEPAQDADHSKTANVAGLESAIAHMSCLLDAFRALLAEVDDVCGRDGFDRVLEEGESEIIDKIRAALAMTNAAPQPAAPAQAGEYPELPMQFACSGVFTVYSANQMRAYADATCAARGAAQAAPVDAERLDYLQECGVTVEVLPGRPGWTFRIGGLHGTVHRSVRTAIDAARAAQPGWCKDCNPDNCGGCATPAAPVDADIIALADKTRTGEPGREGYILPISFARAVLAKWGSPAPASQPVAVPAGPVARIEGIDEYGPRLEWTQHWVDVGVGAKLYTASQVQAMLARAETGAHQCRTLTSQTTTKPPTEAVFIA